MNTHSKTFRFVAPLSLIFLLLASLAALLASFASHEEKRHLLHERWGVAQAVKPEPLAPESDSDKINRLVDEGLGEVHQLQPTGEYGHIKYFPSSFSNYFPHLNDNYTIQGDEGEGLGVLFTVRTTPEACAASAHYWIGSGAVVNGFMAGKNGVLASDLIKSCQKGLLAISLE